MGTQKNTIILNGKIYDTKSGTALSHHKPNKTLDGFIRRHAITPKEPALKQSIAVKTVKPAKNKVEVSHISHPASKIHNRRQKSKTLMRRSVKKPGNLKTGSLSTRFDEPDQSELESPLNDGSLLAKPHRASRAKAVHKSHMISRFTIADSEPMLLKKEVALEVKPGPDSVEVKPVQVKIPKVDQPKTSKQIIAEALGKAVSHQQEAPKKVKRRHRAGKKLGLGQKATNAAMVSLIVLVLGGFVAYQNVSSISMRLAVAKAGVNASLPGYRPSGFALSRNIQSAPGQVTVSFHSNSDDRGFRITQTASSWSSQSLLNNFVATTDQSYQQSTQPNGKTVFTYGEANATWVDGGVWYKIEGNSQLPSDQLLKIANSF